MDKADLPERDSNGYYLHTARFTIGQRVKFAVHGGENDGTELVAYVRAVIFTNAKVRYSLLVLGGDPPDCKPVSEGMGVTIHNVDSANVSPCPGQPEFIEMAFDNYS